MIISYNILIKCNTQFDSVLEELKNVKQTLNTIQDKTFQATAKLEKNIQPKKSVKSKLNDIKKTNTRIKMKYNRDRDNLSLFK